MLLGEFDAKEYSLTFGIGRAHLELRLANQQMRFCDRNFEADIETELHVILKLRLLFHSFSKSLGRGALQQETSFQGALHLSYNNALKKKLKT